MKYITLDKIVEIMNYSNLNSLRNSSDKKTRLTNLVKFVESEAEKDIITIKNQYQSEIDLLQAKLNSIKDIAS